ncbi:N-6 DNA methylase [uncultured Polaribacter sp.]|uniref:Eco57I restriction-modification methylase domain-containing protein n=1 Tax=uncultured Polaribacter sp. TaxID=174711 RepID=UPI00262E4220|nr:N-6 DNA methylase [uncultured Polaribacter sp.]
MSLYQTSVLKNYINLQEKEVIVKAYKKYVKYFLNPTIQENIRSSKEEEYQGIFLTELFVNILGYTLKPKADFNLVAEYKNQTNSRKADGAILHNDIAIGVIELKGTKTKDLESIRKQAFDYKANQKGCVYVITSNFEKLRFYINDATEFEEFNLFEFTKERFQLFYLCLQKDNIINNVPLKIKEASIVQEEKITKDFYKDYSLFKRELYRDLVKQNAKRLKTEASLRGTKQSVEELTEQQKAEALQLEKNVKLTLFKKSQKLIDRFLFIFFAEDRGLLPANSTELILEKWKADNDFGDERPLYNLFKQYFHFLDQGRQGTKSRDEIYAYNGGLFKEDTLLDDLEIDNELLYKHTHKLAGYDFESQVDVNILGHIFENSLNEIESVNAEIEGANFDKQTSKRKKDGVFYTPKYITKYIVENTVGKLCEEKKAALGIKEEEYFKGRKNRNKTTITKLVALLDTYRDWLLQLTICDPACGSGAFLNQALNFLIAEHNYIDELKTKVLGGGFQFSDIENTILENNIFGVDLNEESVEIAKLSLWLRTAQPRRKLNDLSSNIKCGNSLIDSKTVAGDKAFHWETEFPQVFEKGGFDVIIGNPPYVKEAGNKLAFNGLHTHKCYQGKMDLWYLFGCLAINIIKEKIGIVGYIAPNNWVTNDGASLFRNFILDHTKIIEFIDFGDFKVFESAGIQTMIYVMKKTKDNQDYAFEYSKLIDKRISVIEVQSFLDKGLNDKSVSFKVNINKKEFYDNIYSFTNQTNNKILKKIENTGSFSLNKDEVSSGIDIGQDFVNSKSKIILGNSFNIGDGIFNLTNDEYKNYNFSESEKKLLKPFYTPREINRYLNKKENNYWVIYTSSKFKNVNEIEPYPKLKKHLDKFAKVITSDNKPYGLHRTRNENIFKGEKILSIRKCLRPSFSYVNFDSYVNRTFNIIKSERINLEYLNCILNSYLVRFWLKEKGKLQGDIFQVDMTPLLSIPVVEPSIKIEKVLIEYSKSLVSKNILFKSLDKKFQSYLKQKFQLVKLSKKLQNWHELAFGDFIKELNKAIKLSNKQRLKDNLQEVPTLTKKDEFEWLDLFEENKQKAQELQTQINQTDKEIDAMVYELYGLTEEEIEIVENS